MGQVHRGSIFALVFCAGAGLTSLPASVAAQDALFKKGPKIAIVNGGVKTSFPNVSSAPVPLSPGTFIVPFLTNEKVDGPEGSKASFQRVDAGFGKTGEPTTLATGWSTTAFAPFAQNGGMALANGKTQIVLPVRRVFPDEILGTDIVGYFVNPDGSVDPKGEILVTGPGNQSGPVAVPKGDGTAFLAWSDAQHEAGESDWSVKGRRVSGEGKAIGEARLLETKNIGAQLAQTGTQLANGNILLVWTDVVPLEPGKARFIYRGRIVSPNGRNVGPRFVLAKAIRTLGNAMGMMRVAALTNGTFVAVWLDQRKGWTQGSNLGVPYYQMFSETGAPLTGPELLGDKGSTRGYDLSVAALADCGFIVTGTVVPAGGTPQLIAQFVAEFGFKIGQPLVLDTFEDGTGGAYGYGAFEVHAANAGYLLGTPAPTGLFTVSDPTDIYVVWRRDNTPGTRYRLLGQAVTTWPEGGAKPARSCSSRG